MKRILLALAVFAISSAAGAKLQSESTDAKTGSHSYDGSLSFDLAGESSVQRKHALGVMWSNLLQAFNKANDGSNDGEGDGNGTSITGEGNHKGGGRIRGTVNFAGEGRRDRLAKQNQEGDNEDDDDEQVDVSDIEFEALSKED